MFNRILDLTGSIIRLEEERGALLKALIADLEGRDVPVIWVSSVYAPEHLNPGDTFTVLDQIDESSNRRTFYLTTPGKPEFRNWGTKPVGTGPHYLQGDKPGHRFGFINRGEHIVIGRVDKQVVLARGEDLGQPLRRDTQPGQPSFEDLGVKP